MFLPSESEIEETKELDSKIAWIGIEYDGAGMKTCFGQTDRLSKQTEVFYIKEDTEITKIQGIAQLIYKLLEFEQSRLHPEDEEEDTDGGIYQ